MNFCEVQPCESAAEINSNDHNEIPRIQNDKEMHAIEEKEREREILEVQGVPLLGKGLYNG